MSVWRRAPIRCRREAYVSAEYSSFCRHSRIASPSSRRSCFANAGQSCQATCTSRRAPGRAAGAPGTSAAVRKRPRCRRPEVAHQRPSKFFAEKLQQSRRAAATVDHEVARTRIGKAPQPMRFSIHSPTAFVAVQHGRIEGLSANLLVPRVKNCRQPIPHLQQSTRTELHLQMEVEDFDDLRERVAQGIVQPGAEHQHPISQCGARQSVGNDRLDLFSAFRAPVAMNHMFCNHRLDGWNIFDIACPSFLAAAQWPAALRANVGTVLDMLVDSSGRRATAPLMPALAARLFLSAARRRILLLVDRLHSRRRSGSLVRRSRMRRLLIGQHLRLFEQRPNDSVLSLSKDRPGLLLGEHCSQRDIACCSWHRVLASKAKPNQYNELPFFPTPTSVG